MGEPCWVPVAGELLRRAGLDVEMVRPHGRLALPRWAAAGRWGCYDVIHHVGGPSSWKIALVMSMIPRPVVWHWIGSDLLGYRSASGKGLKGAIIRRAVRQGWAHLADSPQLAEELLGEGIGARVVRLLPQQIEARPEPLPERFTVISYWSDQRFAFYRGDWVMELARRFEDVPFRILGAVGRGVQAPPNVCFLGFVKDVADEYRRASVLIRLPEHDSLSAMVLEMLARGRYVIYNQPLEHCHQVRTLEEAARALAELREKTEPNLAGSAWVARTFSLEREADALRGIYAGLRR